MADTHIPFEHKHYLEFCKQTQRKFKCQIVVHIGDLVDNHAISYHEHDPNGRSPIDEMELADKRLKKWFKAFPKIKLCRGNHDKLVDRKGKTVGLPERCFKNFRDIWQLPNGWVDDWYFIINGVLFKHGTGYSGKYPHVQCAADCRKSVVIGHTHSHGGVEWSASEHDIIFGMNVGCGIDRKLYAFDYGKDFKKKPILGCGVVFNNGQDAQFIPLKM